MAEEWKEIPGTDGRYLVSTSGRVSRTLQPFKSGSGDSLYVSVDGKRYSVARLVAEAFIGPSPYRNTVVYNLDTNKENNASYNLVYMSRAQFNSITVSGDPYVREAVLEELLGI